MGARAVKLEFHHINYVAEDVDRMHDFYTRVLGLDDMPVDQFPRTEASEDKGFTGKIRFATEGRRKFFCGFPKYPHTTMGFS